MTKGWQPVPLGRLLRRVKEEITLGDDSTYKEVTVRLWNKGVVLRGEKQGSEIKTNRFRVRAGQLIMSRIDVRNGAIGIVPPELDGAVVSGEFWAYDVHKDQLDSKFLALYVSTPIFLDAANRTSSGTTHRIRAEEQNLLNIKIPIPPLPEQQRILARIDGLARRVEEARGLRRDATEETDVVFASSVSCLYFDEHSWHTVEDALYKRKGSVRSGPFGSQLHHGEFVEHGILAIGTRDVLVNRFSLNSGWFVSPEKYNQLKRYQVFPDDVLCTIVGASIGRFCVVPNNIQVAFTTKHILALTLDSYKANPRFVTYMLNYHSRCRESLFSKRQGSAQPSLNATKVLLTKLPIPPPSEQDRIVAYLDGLQAKVDYLRRLQAETQKELDALMPSILAKAFAGRLVPQDPNDETVERL
jgi:type I restriction enzyme S subunit